MAEEGCGLAHEIENTENKEAKDGNNGSGSMSGHKITHPFKTGQMRPLHSSTHDFSTAFLLVSQEQCGAFQSNRNILPPRLSHYCPLGRLFCSIMLSHDDILKVKHFGHCKK